MQAICISVRFRFEIRKFPISLIEMFIVIKRILEEVGQVLVKELLGRLEQQASELLKGRGCTHHSHKQRIFQGALGRIELWLLRVKHPHGSVRYALSELVELPAYVRHTEDSFEPALGLLPHVSYNRSSLEGNRMLGSSPGKTTLHRRLKVLAPELEVHPTEKARGYFYLVADGTGATFQAPYI